SAEAQNKKYSGLNTSLPEAIFTEEDENWNKFDLYERAKRDSLKFQQAKKNDPYFEVGHLKTSQDVTEESENKKKDRFNTSLGKKRNNVDPNEVMVNQKLEELYRELDRNSTRPSVTTAKSSEVDLTPALNDNQLGSEVDRLEEMMLMMQESSEA